MNITQDDIDFLSKNFPDLTLKDYQLEGMLNFFVHFDEKNKKYNLIEWNTDYKETDYLIRDSYQISINLSPLNNPYRSVINTDSKILNRAITLREPSANLHVYDGTNDTVRNNVCLYGWLEEDQEISLTQFLCEVVVPFFYDQSFYIKRQQWPRGEYSHGIWGIIENYSDQLNIDNNDEYELTKKCINEVMTQKFRDPQNFFILRDCLSLKGKIDGSLRGFKVDELNKKLRDIFSKDAFSGLWKLKNNMKKHNLSIE